MTTLQFLFVVEAHVKKTFLHGDLEEEICLEQSKGFVAADQEHLVYRIKKSHYGIK